MTEAQARQSKLVIFKCGLPFIGEDGEPKRDEHGEIIRCDSEIKGKNAAAARRDMRRHRVSAHPGYIPVKGSILDKRTRLD